MAVIPTERVRLFISICVSDCSIQTNISLASNVFENIFGFQFRV